MPLVSDSGDPRLLRLYRYWQARRGNREFPSGADIDLGDLAFARDQVSLVDVAAASRRFRYRLVAAQVTESLGFDMTGKYVEDVPDLSMREFTQAFYTQVVAARAPVYEIGSVVIARHEWWHEVLALPLASDGSTVDLLLIYRTTERSVPIAPSSPPPA